MLTLISAGPLYEAWFHPIGSLSIEVKILTKGIKMISLLVIVCRYFCYSP
jgi:hypothetical protein